MAIIVGARGTNHKRLQMESGCRIEIRGKGINAMNQTIEEQNMPQHVHIEGDTEANLIKATALLEPLLDPTHPDFARARALGLEQLAVVNGYTTQVQHIRCGLCQAMGHHASQCPEFNNVEMSYKMADVKCEICGDKGHATIDCPQKGTAQQQSKEWREEAEERAKVLEGTGSLLARNVPRMMVLGYTDTPVHVLVRVRGSITIMRDLDPVPYAVAFRRSSPFNMQGPESPNGQVDQEYADLINNLAEENDPLKTAAQGQQINGSAAAAGNGDDLTIPFKDVGAFIGPQGSNIKLLEGETGCQIHVDQSSKETGHCPVQIQGPLGAVEQAKEKVREWLKSREAGGSGANAQIPMVLGVPGDEEPIRLPAALVGVFIGYNSQNMKALERDFGVGLMLDGKKESGILDHPILFSGSDEAILEAKPKLRDWISRQLATPQGEPNLAQIPGFPGFPGGFPIPAAPGGAASFMPMAAGMPMMAGMMAAAPPQGMMAAAAGYPPQMQQAYMPPPPVAGQYQAPAMDQASWQLLYQQRLQQEQMKYNQQ
ncbi:hypothetical protein FOZ63_021155 [Perkinsus olseni]|uniref:Branchpoint-bridging protein n=2 Tax=Perkinsus olseni TaxID=32597 RepID=A0A7J6T0G2_PEROL|nr:hypothetical protein FOZ63_021155 [Perkinsus olseni]